MGKERIDTIRDIVKDAGEIALRRFGKVETRRKADHSVVTDADLEVGEFLTGRLKLNFPDYGILSEEVESSPDIFRKKENVWIIDPIDGTASFAKRLPVWGVVIGLMSQMKPVSGAIYLPLLDEFYYTDENQPSYFESGRWGRTRMNIAGNTLPPDNDSLLLSLSYTHKRLKVDFPGKVRAMGSTSAHICYVARGDAYGAIIKGAIWDFTPGYAILKNAGGMAEYLGGGEIDFYEMAESIKARDFTLMASPSHLENLKQSITKK